MSFINLLAGSTYSLPTGLSSDLGAEWFWGGLWHRRKEGAAAAPSMAGKSDSGGSKLPCSPWVWQYLGTECQADYSHTWERDNSHCLADAGDLTRVLLPTHQTRRHALEWASAWEQEPALSKASSALMGFGAGAGLPCRSWDKVFGPFLSLAYVDTAARVWVRSLTGWNAATSPLPSSLPVSLAKASPSPHLPAPQFWLWASVPHFEILKGRRGLKSWFLVSAPPVE